MSKNTSQCILENCILRKDRAIYVHLLMCWSKHNLKYCMLYSVTQRNISFLYSIYIFSKNMPHDESLKKVQSSSISLMLQCMIMWWWWRCYERLAFATKMHSLWWCLYDVASYVCVNCQRSGSILPPLLELWHCSSYECFFFFLFFSWRAAYIA